MWEDMVTYWAWRGGPVGYTEPPTEKRVEYATVLYPGDETSFGRTMSIAATVFDDENPREINRDEMAWHLRNGATIAMDFQ